MRWNCIAPEMNRHGLPARTSRSAWMLIGPGAPVAAHPSGLPPDTAVIAAHHRPTLMLAPRGKVAPRHGRRRPLPAATGWSPQARSKLEIEAEGVHGAVLVDADRRVLHVVVPVVRGIEQVARTEADAHPVVDLVAGGEVQLLVPVGEHLRVEAADLGEIR